MSQPKPVNFRLIERNDNPELYASLDDIVMKYHGELTGAVIILYWKSGWRPDADNYVRLAQARLATDREKELREHDFTIALNREYWDMLDATHKLVILDDELSRVVRAVDKEGDPREDDCGRPVWRLRKPEIESEAVARHYGQSRAQVQKEFSERLNGGAAEEGSHVHQVMNE